LTDLPKLLVSRALPDSVMDALRDHFDVTCRDTTQPMDLPECRAALADYDVILPTLGDAFGDDAFTGTIRAKGLANFGVGYNHIDVEAARKAGLVVTNTPGAVTDATADIALTLILMTARRAGEGERMVRAGNWQGWHPTQMLGMHISGKTLGVIGMGRIGQAIARRCHHGFGMDVVFHNRSVKSVPGARQLASVAEVCQTADIVVTAVPASPETFHIIDAAALSAMQPQAILVNIARGDVVDEAALIATLRNGGLAGAGLDVYEREPHVPAALMALENVVLLPHLGTAALEVREDMGRMAMDNAVAIAEGRDPPNPV
jgi:gluconate 2-dehydrogenase